MFDLGGRIRDHVDSVAPPIGLAELQMQMAPAARVAEARREPMFKRSMTVLATSFAVVLIAGVAFAQIGAFGNDDPVDEPRVATEQDGDVDVFGDGPDDVPAGADDDHEGEGEHDGEPGADDGDAEDADEPTDGAKEPEGGDEPKDGEGDDPKGDEPDGDEPDGDEPKDDDEPTDDDEPADTTPPEFAILHPTNNQHFEEREVVFEGEVEPGARVFAGDFEADVDAEGHWRIVLLLNEGQNVATLKAVDAAGNVTSRSVTIFYDVPEEPPAEDPGDGEEEPPVEDPGDGEEEPPGEDPGDGEEEPPDEEDPAAVEFTANQQYGSCGEAIPYDEFWGTATPGTTVYVESPYGSGTTVANEEGHWEIRVEFPTAPVGETFTVVVEGDGGRKTFSFVRTEEGGGHEG